MGGRVGQIGTKGKVSTTKAGGKVASYEARLPLNTYEGLKTEVSTTATKIEIPEKAERIIFTHVTAATTVWIGKDNTITADGDNTFPLRPDVPIELNVKKNNDNNLYAIVSSGTVNVYVLGAINE